MSHGMVSSIALKHIKGHFFPLCFLNRALEFVESHLLYNKLIKTFESLNLKIFNQVKLGWTYVTLIKINFNE